MFFDRNDTAATFERLSDLATEHCIDILDVEWKRHDVAGGHFQVRLDMEYVPTMAILNGFIEATGHHADEVEIVLDCGAIGIRFAV